jgi:hypothetical protein
MGNGFTGRLMKTLREKHGLVYTAKCGCDYYEHIGEFLFFTETKPGNFFSQGKRKGVLPLMVQILSDMKKKGITDAELKLAKGNIKGNALLQLQDMTFQTIHNGVELLIRRKNSKNSKDSKDSQGIVPYSKIYETYIEGITKADVNRVIQQYFIKESMCVCIVNEKPIDLEKVKQECKSLW